MKIELGTFGKGTLGFDTKHKAITLTDTNGVCWYLVEFMKTGTIKLLPSLPDNLGIKLCPNRRIKISQ
jgi:hypothetical protein